MARLTVPPGFVIRAERECPVYARRTPRIPYCNGEPCLGCGAIIVGWEGNIPIYARDGRRKTRAPLP